MRLKEGALTIAGIVVIAAILWVVRAELRTPSGVVQDPEPAGLSTNRRRSMRTDLLSAERNAALDLQALVAARYPSDSVRSPLSDAETTHVEAAIRHLSHAIASSWVGDGHR